MWRSLASNAMTILIVLGLAGAFAVHWGKSQFLAQGPLQEAICFQVPQGANIRGVARSVPRGFSGWARNITTVRIC